MNHKFPSIKIVSLFPEDQTHFKIKVEDKRAQKEYLTFINKNEGDNISHTPSSVLNT